MEALVYTLFTAIWWMSSLTILLPFLLLLYLCKYIRNRWFSFFFSKVIIPLFNPKLIRNRRRAFELLKEHFSERKTSAAIEILEIGVGGGANLEFYPENSKLTALDMNESFEKYFRQKLRNYPQINYDKTVINMAENMVDVPDSSYDVVVCTYVMCSVKSVESVLSEVKRVLKPGGKFLFVEHHAFPWNTLKCIPQRFATPLWRIYFNGCCLNRQTDKLINKAGFRHVHAEDTFLNDVPLFFRPQILGIATK